MNPESYKRNIATRGLLPVLPLAPGAGLYHCLYRWHLQAVSAWYQLLWVQKRRDSRRWWAWTQNCGVRAAKVVVIRERGEWCFLKKNLMNDAMSMQVYRCPTSRPSIMPSLACCRALLRTAAVCLCEAKRTMGEEGQTNYDLWTYPILRRP